VQSFATADIVPCVLLDIEDKLKNLKSCIVNSVHDSIVIDVHPTEEQQVLSIMRTINSILKQLIQMQFKIEFNVPLKLDVKLGDNWLDTKDVV
jgi:DNA polymerase I-like protein with 3'-5' exonuclease and polymerase domains